MGAWIDEGHAYVYLGSAAGPQTSPSWSAAGELGNSNFGDSVACAGDVDGDGYSDVIVGSPSYGGGPSYAGKAYLYLGSASGLQGSYAWAEAGTQSGESFGKSVASAGDVDGDGFSDVIVGASGHSDGQNQEGMAVVYMGSAGGLTTTPAWSVQSDQANAHLGRAVSGAGDVNGDGYADVIVGIPNWDQTYTSEGKAQVYLGSATGLAPTPVWEHLGDQQTAAFSWSVSGAGDVNGDGYADILAGSHNYDFDLIDEGGAFLFLGSAAGPQATAAWEGQGNQVSSTYGRSVSSAGDVNGDGFADVIVGAPEYDGGEAGEGAAYLYLGAASGLSQASNWSGQSNQVTAYFGDAVSAAGDVNGDGFGDVLVGAFGFDGGEVDEGKVFLFEGSSAGLAAVASWSAEGNQASASFGKSVDSAGDVNADGYADVIVGAPYYDNDQANEGRVFVFLGGPAGLSTTADWFAESDQEASVFGGSVSGAGDVNGDGFDDVLAGAYNYDNQYTDEGRAYGWFGSSVGLPSSPSWTSDPVYTVNRFGAAIAGAGDVNGDGFADVVVRAIQGSPNAFVYYGDADGLDSSPNWSYSVASGLWTTYVSAAGDVDGDGYGDVVIAAPYFSGPENAEGIAYVFHGSAAGVAAAPSWTVESNQANASYGYSVSAAGDVDGDGYSDLVVGAPYFDDGEVDEGAAFLYLGSATGLSTSASWTAEGDQAGALFGFAVATAGDVDGDGYADIIVGARQYSDGEAQEGAAFLYLGNGADGTSSGWQPTPQSRQPAGSEPIAPGLRSTSDTSFDFAVLAASPFGRTRVKVQVEAKPLGTLFDGASLVTVPSAWTDTTVAGVALQEPISALSAETSYHWRARVLFDPVDGHPQLWSHWLWGGSSGDPEGSHLWTACLADTDTDGQCDTWDDDDDGDGDSDSSDCDDLDASVYTGAPEIADDGIDQNCDGVDTITCFTDTDGDTYGGSATAPSDAGTCDIAGFSAVDTDCDDTDSSIHPGAPESCDGIDSDCDLSLVDEFIDTDGDLDPDCTDLDDDGDGDPDSSDCAALDASIYDGAAESCDEIDSDCDGSYVDEFTDTDGDLDPDCIDLDDDNDGDPDSSDCAALDASIYDGAPESCDAVDSDCDGSLVDEFPDFDGDLDPDCTDDDDDGDGDPDSSDCAALDASVYADAPESCDEVDSDCDGSLVDGFPNFDGDSQPDCVDDDDDDDGDPDTTDCNDTNAAIYDGAPESCDAVDSDCDGSLADEFDDFDSDDTPDCVDTDDDDDGDPDTSDCDDQDASIYSSAPEIADDGIDQDCNGADTVTCYIDGDGDGFGSSATLLAPDGDCVDAGESSLDSDCDDNSDTAFPGAPEACDDVDSDCDGSIVDEFTDTDEDLEPDCEDDDDDDDGFSDAVDCGPTDEDVYPNAAEACDGLDSDCDGSLADEFDDTDGDGTPDCVDVDVDGDGFDAVVDCDDEDAAINPGEAEIPDDGIDQDCNDFDTVTCFEDLDGDTYGSTTPVLSDDGNCSNSGESPTDDDCDDGDVASWPGAPETPDDGVDQDCSGADTISCFVDGDGDGQGSSVGLLADDGDCTDDVGESQNDDDCLDSDASVYDGAPEACDGVDSDCDGSLVDAFDDTDGDLDPDCTDPDDDDDGDSDTTDCAPLDGTVYTGAVESCDGVDSDCDGSLVDEYADLDEDLVPDCSDPDDDGDGEPDGTDCEPQDGGIFPGAPEACDSIDSDCDGSVVDEFDDFDSDQEPDCTDDDDDSDGEPDATDCSPLDPAIYPGASELCDDIDSDCNGSLADGFPDSDGDDIPDCVEEDTDGDGDPDFSDCDDGDPDIYTGAEEIPDDGVDQDCNDTDTVTCFADVDEDGFGSAEVVLASDGVCDDPGESALASDCDDFSAETFPGAAELCNEGIDDDCDPVTDETIDGDGDGLSICADDCDDDDDTVFPGADEICDGIDNDCDPETIEDEADADNDEWKVCDGDCDDEDGTVYPGAPELCDDQDNDCDGLSDADEESLDHVDWYADADGDGFGDPDFPFDGNPECAQPDGYVLDATDCDDASAETHPGAEELCNGVDDDCDPSTDLGGRDRDADADGVLLCAGDCDDSDDSVFPGADEVCDDGVDSDCDELGAPDAPEEPDCWPWVQPEACRDCSGSLSRGSGEGGLSLALLVALLSARRRRPRTLR